MLLDLGGRRLALPLVLHGASSVEEDGFGVDLDELAKALSAETLGRADGDVDGVAEGVEFEFLEVLQVDFAQENPGAHVLALGYSEVVVLRDSEIFSLHLYGSSLMCIRWVRGLGFGV